MHWFLNLYYLVLPHFYLNILIYATLLLYMLVLLSNILLLDHCYGKKFLQSHFYGSITKHFRCKFSFQPFRWYSVFDIFVNLSIHINYWAKVLKWIIFVVSFDLQFLGICTLVEITIYIFYFCETYFKPWNSK